MFLPAVDVQWNDFIFINSFNDSEHTEDVV